MSTEGPDPAVAALAALDRALAQRPRRDGDAFSEATAELCRLRDQRWAAGEDADDLNGVISTMLAGQFPLGQVPWSTVEAARQVLATLV